MVGGVKSALNRGRSKLANARQPLEARDAPDPELTRLLGLYVEPFNRRDWTRLHDVISADARLRITNFFIGKLSDSYLFTYFERMRTPWRFAPGTLDSESIALKLHEVDGAWIAHAATRLDTSRSCACATMSNAHGFLPPPAVGASTLLLHSRLLHDR